MGSFKDRADFSEVLGFYEGSEQVERVLGIAFEGMGS